jgi:peptidoglycan hydrolase-like protein with peptidoglycan-binding domain
MLRALTARRTTSVALGLVLICVIPAASPLGLIGQAPPPTPGIRVVAHFDPNTDERTFEVLAPLSGSEILSLQEALARMGVDPGARDGQLGPATRAAVTRFQRDRGLGVCGCVSYETVLVLGLRARVVQTVIGPAPDFPQVEVIMPRGVPAPPPSMSGVAPSDGPADPGSEARAGQGTDYSPPAPPPGYRGPGIWIPVFPYHPSVLEPIYGFRPGDRPPPAGDAGGVPFGPDSPRQGLNVPVIRPSPPARPTPGRPVRPVPPRPPSSSRDR